MRPEHGMPRSSSSLVATCPDCGGILHPVRMEQLTSVEVASADDRHDAELHLQCLLCGYAEARACEHADEPVLPA
jgi:hypothetical protein